MYAMADVGAALSNLRGWSYLASKQIQLEHRRTWIGSGWIVIAFALTSAGIGVLMAQLQGRPITQHVPYVMFGFAAWNFISSAVTGGCNVMVNAKPYLLQMRTPRSVFVLSMTLRNFYLLIIQLATATVVSLLLGWRPDLAAFWVLPAILVYAIAGFGTATFLGLVGARFRDISRLVEAVMRLTFFFTPIIWTADSGRGGAGGLIGFLMDWNPFTYVLETFRSGLLGEQPGLLNWAVTLGISGALLVAGLIALQVSGRRVTYWL
jgi:ABC-type polysaccharide/polyol phosphate export permease